MARDYYIVPGNLVTWHMEPVSHPNVRHSVLKKCESTELPQTEQYTECDFAENWGALETNLPAYFDKTEI